MGAPPDRAGGSEDGTHEGAGQGPTSSPAEWELELPTRPAAPPRPPPRRAAPAPPLGDLFSMDAPSAPTIDLTAPVEQVLDVFSIDDEDTPGIDLAVPLASPGASRRPAGTARSGLAGRGIHIRSLAALPSQTGAVVRLILAALLLAGLALGRAYLSPPGLATVQRLLGAHAYLAFGGATLLTVVALVVVAAQGMRRVSYTLFLASIGLTVMTAAGVTATAILAAPGLMPATLRKATLIAAPWAVVAVIVGLGAFAFLHARRLRREEEDEQEWSRVLLSSSLIAAAGLVWVLLQPHTRVADVTHMSLVPQQAELRAQLERFAVVAAGAAALREPTAPGAAGSAAAAEPAPDSEPR